MPLHIDYRPDSFDQVIGNGGTLAKLQAVLAREDHPHNYLLHGPKGCGKTTLARIIAQEVGCSSQGPTEVNAADTRGIDAVRQLIRRMYYRPLGGGSRVVILDEAHHLTKEAQTALLKPCEDTPEHAYFILCTTEYKKLLPTLRERMSCYEVARPSRDEIVGLLEGVVEAEGADVSGKSLRAIGQACESPRHALTLLEQVIGLGREVTSRELEVMEAEEANVKDLCQALLKKEGWPGIVDILNGLTEDAESTRWRARAYFNKVLRGNRGRHRAALILEYFSTPFYDDAALAHACYMSLLD